MNNQYRARLQKAGLRMSGINPEHDLVKIQWFDVDQMDTANREMQKVLILSLDKTMKSIR